MIEYEKLPPDTQVSSDRIDGSLAYRLHRQHWLLLHCRSFLLRRLHYHHRKLGPQHRNFQENINIQFLRKQTREYGTKFLYLPIQIFQLRNEIKHFFPVIFDSRSFVTGNIQAFEIL